MEDAGTTLSRLEPGMILPYAGDRFATVNPELAGAFRQGDAVVVSQRDGTIVHIPAEARRLVGIAISQAAQAFTAMRHVSRDAIATFFEAFVEHLQDRDVWSAIERANAADVDRALVSGHGVARLRLADGARETMIDGLLGWAHSMRKPAGEPARVDHGSWNVEASRSPLGTIGFVFEGRPNVLVDACGVLASGNTAVLRIGSDAVKTASVIMRLALRPAFLVAGLPLNAVVLLPPLGREAAWALCTDRRLSLAIVRGSGQAVRLLGDLATQSGVPVSLHGTGGGWLIADASASVARFEAVVEASLDRKVCNTLNTCCIVESRARDLVPAFLRAVKAAAARSGGQGHLHVAQGSKRYLPSELFALDVDVMRRGSSTSGTFASPLPIELLGTEWEWDRSPEVSLVVVRDLEAAVDLANRHSPKFVASLIADDESAHDAFFDAIDAPFVGDGFTRWVDGQYALNVPELGLSNWEFGRPLGRSAVLTGEALHTLRHRMRQVDPFLRR